MAEGDQVFDSAALMAQIQKTVADGLATVPAAVKQTVTEMAQQGAQQQAQAQQAAANAQQAAADPILGAVYPALKPFLDNATLSGLAGQDAAVFYATNKAAASHVDEIERRFQQSVAQGRPIARSAIFNHYKGEHFEKFYEEETKAREEAAQRALLASTVGGGSPRVLQQEPGDFHEMAATGDSLNSYLADKAW